jgi:hypothetical protein
MTQERDHLAILREGTERWNRWRVANQSTRPQLAGADLSEVDLGMESSSQWIEEILVGGLVLRV